MERFESDKGKVFNMPITAADADCSVPYVCVFKCLHRQSILPIYLTIRDPCWGLAPPPLSYLLTSFRSDNDAFTSRMHDLSLIPAFKWMYFATFDCSIWAFPILSWTELNWTELNWLQLVSLVVKSQVKTDSLPVIRVTLCWWKTGKKMKLNQPGKTEIGKV